MAAGVGVMLHDLRAIEDPHERMAEQVDFLKTWAVAEPASGGSQENASGATIRQ